MKKQTTNNSSVSSSDGKLSVRVRTAKGRKTSSTRWLRRQLNDPYVELAKQKGYASRAAFKLLEINEKYDIFSKVKTAIDLGSSPGSWSQILSQTPSIKTIIAIDLLEMRSVDRVNFIVGDFRDDEVRAKVFEILKDEKLDLIVSDMAPNFTGHKQTDHLRTIGLCEEVIEFAIDHLNIDGHMIIKSFQGGESTNVIHTCKQIFNKVLLYKPKASRSESSEMYMLCLKYKAQS